MLRPHVDFPHKKYFFNYCKFWGPHEPTDSSQCTHVLAKKKPCQHSSAEIVIRGGDWVGWEKELEVKYSTVITNGQVMDLYLIPTTLLVLTSWVLVPLPQCCPHWVAEHGHSACTQCAFYHWPMALPDYRFCSIGTLLYYGMIVLTWSLVGFSSCDWLM